MTQFQKLVLRFMVMVIHAHQVAGNLTTGSSQNLVRDIQRELDK